MSSKSSFTHMHFNIISGRSGSGKTVVLHALEDLGFYCIDNCPITLLSELPRHLGPKHERVAVSVDARNLSSDQHLLSDALKRIQQLSLTTDIIYLDASDDVLIRRFSETRRPHPLTHDGLSLRLAISLEYELLSPLAALADLVIDTSALSRQSLSQWVRQRLNYEPRGLQVLIQSFGFKYGIPVEADFVWDIRVLKNPYWEPELSALSGQDAPVKAFLDQDVNAQLMLGDLKAFLSAWIPRFASTHRSYLTFAIGCTGGQHRSVYLCEKLYQELKKAYPGLQLQHRELNKHSAV